ncbi:hypothetical protein, partial [Phenylobacterium sp.]|uniref:hypothetical protein n=2 Tax=Phenylobacterium sp. TaxID=1871053 RepID=UPI00273072EA
ICHQFNWDFLQSAMANWLLPSPEQRLDEIAETRPATIAALLASYPKPERIRAQQRARMLRHTANVLRQMLRSGELEQLLAAPRLEGGAGFYELMRQIPAFAEDELEKKVRVLAHDLHREEIVVFADPENLKPAVEYHLLRLYLRTGRVYATKESVRDRLRSPGLTSRDRLVKLLRQSVEEAMIQTAFYAGMDVATLNYVEWQIGRAICTPDFPRCERPPISEIAPDVAPLSSERCVYAGFCRSFTDVNYGWFHEPHFQKAIY